MQAILERLEKFMLSNTMWMFFTGILAISTVLIYQGGDHSWAVYLGYVGKISILFLPVLVFVLLKNYLYQHLPLFVFILLWIGLFLAYPHFMEVWGTYKWIDATDLGKVFIRATGTWFIITELIILGDWYWRGKLQNMEWFKRISLEQGILFFTALFALFYSIIGFIIFGHAVGITSIWTKISYTIQIFIICLIYYCFYSINHYFLIQKVWQKGGVVRYGFSFLLVVLALSPIAAQLIAWLPMVRETNIHPVNNGKIFEDINFWIPFLGMLASIPFVISLQWYRQRSAIDHLEKEKSATELSLLKQQINPHFFFNTLNNLYALSIKKDKATPEVVLQLSELMRYVIYKGKEDWVKLAEEVKYIEDYINLQQIRLHKKLDYRFEKHIQDEHLTVPPLLFILLIENAFKHGVEPAEEDCFLHMRLETNEKSLSFYCSNSIEELVPNIEGIGLENLRRRLNLRFPGKHEFWTEIKENTFEATLKIDLS